VYGIHKRLILSDAKGTYLEACLCKPLLHMRAPVERQHLSMQPPEAATQLFSMMELHFLG
jgi:hypothetical protein